MRKEVITRFVCEICDTKFLGQKEAEECESKEVTMNKGVKVGDMVLVTKGPESGNKTMVIAIGACPKGNGSPDWNKIWHTIGVTIRVGNRELTLLYDQYEIAPPEPTIPEGYTPEIESEIGEEEKA